MPGAIGVDVYRIIQLGKQNNSYNENISIIFTEKIIGLFTCFLIISIIYPFVNINLDTKYNAVIIICNIFCILFIILLLSNSRVKKRKLINNLLNKIESRINKSIYRITKKVSPDNKNEHIDTIQFRKLFQPFNNNRVLFIVFSFSVLNQFTSALFINILFRACGYNISIIANLFVVPLLNILFLLPVSLGGIGVRESGYILLYGLFGVPVEVALLVSLLAFSFLLLHMLIGGVIMLLNSVNIKKENYLSNNPNN